MTEREQLEQTIKHLENQRRILGDKVVEAALLPLRERMATLDAELDHNQTTTIFHQVTEDHQGSSSFTGERRMVTILFCDVRGSTAMASTLDPEEWARMIQLAMDYMIEPIQKHGGTVSSVRGDGMLAFFGAPKAHEDDPQRAVMAGLEIIEVVRGFAGRLRRDRGIDFNVRVGIHTGLVVVGELGRFDQSEYTAFGDAVNMAARMEQTAQAGTVQISNHTFRLIEHAFECQALGDIMIKGRSKPMAVYSVLGPKVATSARGLEREGLSSSMVGRERELRAGRELIKRLQRGQGAILGIIGEAGLGKTRLKRELQNSAENVQWLEGRTLSYGQSISYWPFLEILRSHVGITEHDSEPAAWSKLEERILALFPDSAAEVLPYLATLLALDVPEKYAERVRYLDGDALGKRLFLAMRRFAEALASVQPLVLVVEDLHWMDDASARLLEHLLGLVREAPVLMLVLTRPDSSTAAHQLRQVCQEAYQDRYTELELAPLTASQSAQLVNNLLSADSLPADVRSVITHKADGNPFYIEEIIRSMLDTGSIVRDPVSTRWSLTLPVETLEIPDTLQGVIMARIDRLDEPVKQTLRMAAVIGRSFLYRILQELGGTNEALERHLELLQKMELIRIKQTEPELEFAFIHALAQEAAYESILLKKRRHLHERVARAVEKLLVSRLDEFSSLVAYHYARAENWEMAREYLLRSGDQAGKTAADTEALGHYQQAMQAYDRVSGGDWNPIQRAALERKIGTALFRRGHTEEAAQHLFVALDVLDHPLPSTTQTQRLAILREALEQITHLLLPWWLVKPLKEKVTPEFEEQAAVLEQITWLFVYTRIEYALIASLRLLNRSERVGYARGMSFGLMSAGAALTLYGQFGLAKNFLNRAHQAALFTGDPIAISYALLGLRLPYGCLAEFDKALSFAKPGIELTWQIGDLSAWATLMSDAAVMYNYQGCFDESEVNTRKIINLGRELSDSVMLSYGLSTLGFALWRLGRVHEARQCLEEAGEVSRRIKNHYSVVAAGGELGRCYLLMGEMDKATDVLFSAEQLNRHYRAGWGGEMPLLLGLVELYLAKEDLPRARQASQDAIRRARMFMPAMPDALRLRGLVECRQGDIAGARKTWLKALALAERKGQRFDAGQIRNELREHKGLTV